MVDRKNKTIKKILVIDLDNIGDVAMASFLPRSLKKLYPDSYVAFLAKEYSAGVVENNPFVNEIIIFNPWWSRDRLNRSFKLWDALRLILRIRALKFDMAFIVNADWRKAALAFVCGIPLRIGESKKRASLFLTKLIPFVDDPKKHRVTYNTELLKIAGGRDEEVTLEIFPSVNAKNWAQDFLAKNKIAADTLWVGIHPGAGHPARIWPAAYFVQLVKLLLERQNIHVLLFGTDRDKNVQEIANTIQSSRLTVVKNIDVQQMAALFQKCAVVVAQDSGPMHVAVAAGAKVVAVFGPSNEHRFGPYGREQKTMTANVSCRPCGSDPECDDRQCLLQISPEQVFKAVEEVL